MAFEPQNGPATQPSAHAFDTLYQRIVDRLNTENHLLTDQVRADHAAMGDEALALKNRVAKLDWMNEPEKRKGLETVIGLQDALDKFDRSETPLESMPEILSELNNRVGGLETLIQEAEHRKPPQGVDSLDPRAEYIEAHSETLMQDPKLRAAMALDPRLSLDFNALTDRYLRRGRHALAKEQEELFAKANHFVRNCIRKDDFEANGFTPELMNAIRPDFTPGAGLFISPTIDARIRQKLTEFSPIINLVPRAPSGSNTYEWMQETGALPTSTTVSPHAAGGAVNTNEELWSTRKTDIFTVVTEIPIIRQMLDDSSRDLLGLLTNLVARRFAKVLSQWIVTGTGAGQPYGVTVDSGVTTVNTGVADEVTLHSLLFLKTQLPGFYEQNAEYVLGDDAYTAAVIELDADGRPKWNPTTAAALPPTLYGDRVHRDTYYQDADTVTAEKVTFTAADVVATYAAWSQFGIMPERHGTRFLRTESAKAGESQQIDTAWYARMGFAVDLAEAGRNLVVNA